MQKKLSQIDKKFILENFPLPDNIKEKIISNKALSKDDYTDLWDMLTDQVGLEFDENDQITNKGIVMESLIDKIYDILESKNNNGK